MQEKTLKLQSTNNQKEKQILKQECLAISDEKIKIAMQLEKEIKKSITFLNKKIGIVQSEISKTKVVDQQSKVEPIKQPPKKYVYKKERQERGWRWYQRQR